MVTETFGSKTKVKQVVLTSEHYIHHRTFRRLNFFRKQKKILMPKTKFVPELILSELNLI